jgi:hypothetical protein
MKKQLVVIWIILVLIAVGLSGCTNNSFDTERNKFVGTWKSTPGSGFGYGTLTFFSNGTFTIGASTTSSGQTWEIKDGKLVFSGPGGTTSSNFMFSNNDNTLTLTQTTISEVFTKQ